MDGMAKRGVVRQPPVRRHSEERTASAVSLAPRPHSTSVLDRERQALLDLQRTAGNRAVTELVRGGRLDVVVQRDSPPATATAPAPAPAAAATTPAVPADPDDIAWIDSLTVNQLQLQIDTETWSKAKEAQAEGGIQKQGDAEAAAYKAKQQKAIAKLTKAKKDKEAAAATEEMEDKLSAMKAATTTKVGAAKEKYLTHRQANRRQFMITMRGWFGTDDKIKEHFQNIASVAQPNGDTAYLYKPAADRLSAVQEIIKARGLKPPSVGNSQWLRNRHLGHWSKGFMGHPMGLSVDYDAYSNPKISDDKLTELIRLVTVGPKGEKSDVPSRLALPGDSRKTAKEMGESTKAADEALAQGKGTAAAADVDLTKTDKYKDFFETFNDQFDKLAAGSKTFQSDLGADSLALLQRTKLRYIQVLAALPSLQAEIEGIAANLKAAAVADKPNLLKKRQELQARRDAMADELEAMPTALATAFKPWLDKVAERMTIVKDQSDKDGVVAAKVPLRKTLNQADNLLAALIKAEAGAKTESGKKKPNLAPWDLKIQAGKKGLATLVGAALQADPKTWTSAEWKAALKILRRWNEAGLGDEWRALQQLQTRLTDVTYVFGQVTDVGGKRRGAINDALATLATDRKSATLTAMAAGQKQAVEEAVVYGSKDVEQIDAKTKVTYGTAKRVLDPSPMQLIEMGYFNPTDTFSKVFFELMMEHGFQPGAAWSPGSTDPMHFDYVASFDDIAEGKFGPT
jgi:hypothetical protein